MTPAAETKLIVGCGYLGLRVAERWLAAGHRVSAVTRSSRRAGELERRGIRALIGDVADPHRLPALPRVDTVLFAVGYDRSDASAPPIEQVYAGGFANVLAALPVATPRVIYISSTGVYGPADGGVVDEQTPPAPQRDGGRASLAAEQALAAHALGPRGVVLRLAGIYGPDRVPYLKKLQAGEPIAAPCAGWLNLIHVDDAASTVLAAESWFDAAPANSGPHLFCICDGHPVVRRDFYGEVAHLLDAAPPEFVDPPADSRAAVRATTSRQISNARMIAQLGPALAYPDYRAGLASILSGRRLC